MAWTRRLVLSVVIGVSVVACSGGDDSDTSIAAVPSESLDSVAVSSVSEASDGEGAPAATVEGLSRAMTGTQQGIGAITAVVVEAVGADPVRFRDVVEIDGRLIAAGYVTRNGDLEASAWSSQDGDTWERMVTPGLSQGTLVTALERFGGRLVAGGFVGHLYENDAAIWLSDDGSSWTLVSDADLGGPAGQTITEIRSTSAGLIALGGVHPEGGFIDGLVWLSDDGESWDLVSSPVFGGSGHQQLLAVAEIDGRLVIGGDDDNKAAVWVSTDGGHSWTRSPSPDLATPNNSRIYDIVAFDSGLVAVGLELQANKLVAAMWSSADGVIWMREGSSLLDDIFELHRVMVLDEQLIAFGRGYPNAQMTAIARHGTDWMEVDAPDEPMGILEIDEAIGWDGGFLVIGHQEYLSDINQVVWKGITVSTRGESAHSDDADTPSQTTSATGGDAQGGGEPVGGYSEFVGRSYDDLVASLGEPDAVADTAVSAYLTYGPELVTFRVRVGDERMYFEVLEVFDTEPPLHLIGRTHQEVTDLVGPADAVVEAYPFAYLTYNELGLTLSLWMTLEGEYGQVAEILGAAPEPNTGE